MRRSHIDDKIAAMMAKAEAAQKQRAPSQQRSDCTTKDRYNSEADARAVVLMNGMEHKLATYRCESCQLWHLTRRNKK